MAIKRLSENPTITDTILFDILTPDSDGCFVSGCPYKVIQAKIYFLERSLVQQNFGEYEVSHDNAVNNDLKKDWEEAKAAACLLPTDENLKKLAQIQLQIDLQTKKDQTYYKDAALVATFGSETVPAWIEGGEDNALTLIDETAEGEVQYGHFELQWQPSGIREGNYFICWNWVQYEHYSTEDIISAHEYFTISSPVQESINIPSHYTKKDKYSTLSDRYLASMFKTFVSNNDETPYILRGVNNSASDGFTFLEDMGNQIVDLLDANTAHQYYLPALANLFAYKLRSGDVTLWRRQIKRAMPLLKRKGTLRGLQEALAQAGIEMVKFTKLWQVISPYTWQECFTYVDTNDFVLEKVALAPTPGDLNFELYYRGVNDSSWTQLTPPLDYVSITTAEGVSTLSWITTPLAVGDSIRVIYQVTDISSHQTLEDYIRALPLIDTRDERSQEYPPKNWNVRAIEEDDPFFDVVITTKHPFYNDIIWGQIRTEFPYSENAYNMEEYSGSTRDSLDPCDIDKEFVDPCKWGQSSSYTIDLKITNISDDRIAETLEILKEFTPFHATLHTMYLGGLVEDFIQPQDEITVYVTMRGEETTISGNGQLIFNRVMVEASQGDRESLAAMTPVPSESIDAGTGRNEYIMINSPLIQLDRVGLNESSNLLEILSGSNSGEYTISNANKNQAEISGVIEPFSSGVFTYRLSNEIFTDVVTTITQDDVFTFSDANIDITQFEIMTQHDADHTPSIIPWSVEVTLPVEIAGTYTVADLSCGNLILNDPALPTIPTTDITYNLKNSSAITVVNSATGSLTCQRRGLVDVSSLPPDDMRNFVQKGYYLEYLGEQYIIEGFKTGETHQFYIDGYSDGVVVGVTTNLYQRLVDNQPGYLHYQGMKLTTATDYETLFDIKNGDNAPVDENLITDNDLFMQNYMVMIGDNYYAITRWNKNDIYLVGPPLDWGVSTSTTVYYQIYHFTKNAWSVFEKDVMKPSNGPEVVVPGHDFTFLDRRGNEVIEVNIENSTTMMANQIDAYVIASALNSGKQNMIQDSVAIKENISYKVEYRDEPNKQ